MTIGRMNNHTIHSNDKDYVVQAKGLSIIDKKVALTRLL